VDLDSTAAELYGLDPGEFVAARSDAEKRARAAGDRELASRLKGLAKPTAAAWIANQLVRQHPEQIAGLRELGAGMREATATLEGEQLRSLSQQQNRVIQALVAQGRTLARAAGHAMSEATERGLDATLRAALADEELADQLAAGQLSTALEHVGFSTAIPAGAVPKPAPAPSRRDELEGRRRRRRQLDQARADIRQARSAHQEASRALQQAEAAVAHAEQERGRARDGEQQTAARLQEAEDALARLVE
jgi:hypothetical protein